MDIAIIGMAGRFPKARNIEELFTNIKQKKDCVSEISQARIDKTLIPQSDKYDFAGYLEDIDLFDHKFFNVSLKEAEFMDPRQRLILETSYNVLENSGYSVDHFKGSNTAVFGVNIFCDYYQYVNKYDPTLHTGNLNSAIAGKIARTFNLRGNAVMVDTACSTGLLAVHMACNELRLGLSDMALVAGAEIRLLPNTRGHETKFDIESNSDFARCKAFSADSDGIVLSEVVAGVLLKPLDQALKDKDNIHAVIKASAANQDAALSSSLTAPDSDAQSEVIAQAWSAAGIDVNSVDYIECHGTGTKLGDPIEVEGIKKAFERLGVKREKLVEISSVKSNLGHPNMMAGLVGLIKAVNSIKKKTFLPSLHCERLNPLIDFKESGVSVTRKLKKWNVDSLSPRRAAVNSFGLIGTNCHLLLEEFIKPQETDEFDDEEFLFVFSAKSQKSLIDTCSSVKQFLVNNPRLNVRDFSYTLLSGRKFYKNKISFWANNVVEIVDRLNGFITREDAGLEKTPKVIFWLPAGAKTNHADGEILHSVLEKLSAHEFDATDAEIRKLPSSFALLQYRLLDWLNALGVQPGAIYLNESKQLSLKQFVREMDFNAFSAFLDSSNGEHSTKFVNDLIAEKKDTCLIILGSAKEIATSSKEADLLERVVSLELDNENALEKFFMQVAEKVKLDNNYLLSSFLNGNKIELPSYEFDSVRCWYDKERDSNSLNSYLKASDITDQTFNFRFSELPKATASAEHRFKGKNILILGDNLCTSEISNGLKSIASKIIEVNPSVSFERVNECLLQLDFGEISDIQQLYDELTLADIKIDIIINTIGFEAPAQSYDEVEEGFIFTYYNFSKVFFEKKEYKKVQIINVNRSELDASDEICITPFVNFQIGFVKGLSVDYSAMDISNMHFQSDLLPQDVVRTLIDVYSQPRDDKFLYKLKDKLYVEQLYKEEVTDEKLDKFKLLKDATYLFTGGTGLIGLSMLECVAKYGAKNLIVLGRKRLDRESAGNIHILQKFEELKVKYGVNIDYYRVDVGSEEHMNKLLSELKEKYDIIHYFMHLAGVTDFNKHFGRKEKDDFRYICEPKVQGLLNLDLIAQQFDFERFVCFSSLGAKIPALEMTDYSAANCFMDSYVRNKNNSKYLSINLPGWLSDSEINSLDEKDIRVLNKNNGPSAVFIPMALGGSSATTIVNFKADDVFSFAFFRLHPSLNASSQSLQTQENESYAGPVDWTDSEKKIFHIWSDLLKTEQIELDDDFFDLGGHSLIGSQMVNRVSDIFKVDIEFEQIYDYSTIKELADYVDDVLGAEEEGAKRTVLKVADTKELYPLSFEQLEIWAIQIIKGVNNLFNIPSTYLLDYKIQKDALEKAINALIKKHSSLRTVFCGVDGEPFQKILENDTEYQINYDESGKTKEEVLDQIESKKKRAFDLTQWPLFEVSLFKTKDADFILFLNIHHSICDAISFAKIFMKDLLNAYEIFSSGKELAVSSPKLSYVDYAEWQQASFANGNFDEQKTFWQKKLHDVQSLKLPYDKQEKTSNGAAGEELVVSFDKASSEQIRLLAQEQKVSVYILLIAALKIVFYRYSAQTNITVGTSVSNRGNIDLEDILGHFANLLPVSTTIDRGASLAKLIKQINDEFLEVLKYKDYPYSQIVKDLNESASKELSVETVFTWHSDIPVHLSPGGRAAVRLETMKPHVVAKWDLEIHGWEFEDCISLSFTYRLDLFENKTIATLCQNYKRVVEAMLTGLDSGIIDIELKTGDESSAEAQEKDCSIDEMFEF